MANLVARMVWVPAGTFLMGDPKSAHTVAVKAFKLGAYEVTFDQYDTFATATGRTLPNDQGWGRGQLPVINVSWDDAQAFATWLKAQSGVNYRLPTEAEWEYAARAGTTTDYPWGSTASHEQANYGKDDCCAGLAQGRDQWIYTAPVGSFPPNAFGLYDMIGNVWEWTEDCYHEAYVGAPVDGSAWLSGDCGRRVFRGGSWADDPQSLPIWSRTRDDTTGRSYSVGFRLAQDL